MAKTDAKSLDEAYIVQSYGRYPVTIDHGKGATLYDDKGNSYIDFASGIGTLSLGTADKHWLKAVTEQLEKTQHISNYFYSEPTSKLAKKLVTLSGLKRAFFANSGAEANEGAIKVARKYSYDKYGKGRNVIVTLEKSFHGRTITTLAATGQDQFHDFFFPFTEGFRYTPANDVAALEKTLTDDVCAVFLEPIQGESGVNLITDDYFAALNELCAKKDILILFDEVQTGIGRTGKLFCYQYTDILPDIVTVAKGLGSGLPIGAFLVGEKCETVIDKGQHGTTFGGNPVSCAGAIEVLNRVSDEAFLQSVNEKGEYIKQKLREIGRENITDIRGKGLMIGIETTHPIKLIALQAVKNGLLVLTAGTNVVRLLPPLTITYQEIDAGLAILSKMF